MRQKINLEKQPLLNTYVNNLTMEETVRELINRIQTRTISYIMPVNVDVLIKMETDSYLKKIAEQADLTLVDGTPLLWIAKFHQKPVKQKISGSDLVPALLEEAAKEHRSVYLLGGMEETAKKAVQSIRTSWGGLRIVGFDSPPIGFEKNKKELMRINERIQSAKPDILLVCLGCPKQEKWVYENYKKTGAVVTICAGATVDFLAGTVKRAPKWVSSVGLEWFYRFLQEPRRLFQRYFIDDMKIFGMILTYYPRRQSKKERNQQS